MIEKKERLERFSKSLNKGCNIVNYRSFFLAKINKQYLKI